MRQEWESHRKALDVMKQSKGKHPKQTDKKRKGKLYIPR